MGISRDLWLDAINAVGGRAEVDDRDALTLTEFKERFAVSKWTADKLLRALVAQGKAIKTTKRTTVGPGTRLVAAWRLK